MKYFQSPLLQCASSPPPQTPLAGFLAKLPKTVNKFNVITSCSLNDLEKLLVSLKIHRKELF